VQMKVKSRRVLVAATLSLLACVSAVVLVRQLTNRSEVHRIVSLHLVFQDEQDVGWLRERIMAIKGSNGVRTYQDVEVQSLAEDGGPVLGARSRRFQVRLYSDLDRLDRFSTDIRNLLESEPTPKTVRIIRQ